MSKLVKVDGVKGLYIRKNKNGDNVYCIRLTHKGKTKKTTVGLVSYMPLVDAIAYKKQLALYVKTYNDPTVMEQLITSSYTVGEMLNDWNEEHVSCARSYGTYVNIRNLICEVIPNDILKLTVEKLKLEHVEEVLFIKRETPATSERLRLMFGSSFEWGIRKNRIPSALRVNTHRIKLGFYKKPEYN